ncbi:uncharacterized protein LOC135241416 isoform X4 [Anguilla rostrata]|uniref:uncharacterized protein LOC135241416 isoform X4 n=1 Tax=Anguilla rostrata TaxID=7938 RepID=UPI0030D4D6E7
MEHVSAAARISLLMFGVMVVAPLAVGAFNPFADVCAILIIHMQFEKHLALNVLKRQPFVQVQPRWQLQEFLQVWGPRPPLSLLGLQQQRWVRPCSRYDHVMQMEKHLALNVLERQSFVQLGTGQELQLTSYAAMAVIPCVGSNPDPHGVCAGGWPQRSGWPARVD